VFTPIFRSESDTQAADGVLFRLVVHRTGR